VVSNVHDKTVVALDKAHRRFLRDHGYAPATTYIYLDTDERTVLGIRFEGTAR
jgi:hypothetical protein